jgi:hypothetical protein
MSDSSYGSVYVEGVTYIDEREIAKRDAEIERLREGERAADAEIERLREEVKLLNSFRPDAELARLRGLLREWLVVGSLLQGNDKIVFSDLVDATKAALTTPCLDE